MIDLMQFCYNEKVNPKLSKPFTRDEYTYACNGYMIVRVPKREEWPNDATVKFKPTSYYNFSVGNRIYADLIIPWEWTILKYVSHHKPEMQCNGFLLNHVVIYKIYNLPEIKTYFPLKPYTEDNPNQCFFKFDGGCGLALGMKPYRR